MITRLVKLSLQPSKAAEFETIFKQNQQLIENFEGCQKTDLFKVSGSQAEFFTISYWDNEEHLDKYRNSELFKSVWSKVKPLFADKAAAWTLNEVTAV